MKLFSASQIRAWDQYTIEHEPIFSIDLMERAALKCTNWIIENEMEHYPIKIFCGKGNNGGDGLAIARLLAEQGIFSRIYILELFNNGSNDFEENLQRLQNYTTDINIINNENNFPVIKKDDVVIDALYGTGLNRKLEGLSKALVDYINQANSKVISIDVPSGMFPDSSSENNAMVRATYTLTFQIPKLAFLLPKNEEFVGDLHVCDIGLHKQFQTNEIAPYQLIDLGLVKTIYKPRKKFSHKGTFGHSLIIAGSKGKMGAAQLCCKACLRTGVGLLTCLAPTDYLGVMQTTVAEAMCITNDNSNAINYYTYASVGIGPGLGTEQQAKEQLINLLNSYPKPIVFDADAINLLSEQKDLLSKIPAGSILTPHPKEFERLFGKYDNDFERLQIALDNAAKYNCYIILKGHYTFIACPNAHGYFNSTGNPGMATAGSGDVLTGITTSLIAQNYSPEEACVLGVYLHGLSGDLAAEQFSEEALIASDLIEFMGEAFKKIAQ